MSVAVVIERIRSSVSSGALVAMPDAEAFIPVRTIGDLTEPWEKFHPGNVSFGDRSGSVFHGKFLRRLRGFKPQPRRSRRPLPRPLWSMPSPKPLGHGIFESVSAIWFWYQAKELADPQMLALPWNSEGLRSFVEPLSHALSDYDPLNVDLEEIGYGHSALDLEDGILLYLPCRTYEDECIGVFEAFLSGDEAVASILTHYLDNAGDRATVDASYDIELPDKDLKLIAEIGFPSLVQAYLKYPGEKSVNMESLWQFGETYFGSVAEKFPDQWEQDFPVISGDGGSDSRLCITCPEDIDFALAYAEAYEKLLGDMPDSYAFDGNVDGECETFIHEVCEVYRKVNGKRAVKWESPKRNTLSYLYRKEGAI